MDSVLMGQQIEFDAAAFVDNADDDARYAAVVARDEGAFFYGVTSTGVFCRPSCKARTPLRKNVRFFTNPADAEAAGFRACKRCKPTQPTKQAQEAALAAQATTLIDRGLDDGDVDFAAIAAACGVSRHHFHRVFTAAVGTTPGAWLRGRREERLRQALPSSTSVTAAGFDAGFNSSGRLYASTEQALGMKPAAFRKKRQGERIVFATAACDLGVVLVASTDKGVCCILLGDDAATLIADLRDRFAGASFVDGDAAYADVVAAVVAFVEAPRLGLALPLDVRGTAFQQRVWTALRAIPVGKTASYADVAAALGDKDAVRAVAGACARNAIAVAIPCHRVVKSDGGLSGYRWGVPRKKALLQREAAKSP